MFNWEKIRDISYYFYNQYIAISNIPAYLLLIKDLLGKYTLKGNSVHIKAAIDWICNAQDATPDKGVSRSYIIRWNPYFKHIGWLPSYPETTGYIIPTMFDYYSISSEEQYRKRAIDMADWLCEIQMENGAIQGGYIGQPLSPSVFNTGQVIFGWLRAYKEVKDKKYIIAAEKAGRFLVKMQDKDGAWRVTTSFCAPGPNPYYTRVAWALLKLNSFTGQKIFKEAAMKNLKWAITMQYPNGWFKNNCLSNHKRPLTHTIAYATRGILESGLILKDDFLIERAKITADKLLEIQMDDGSLVGCYNFKWQPVVNWRCLTGIAQISIIWLKLYKLFGNKKYLLGAHKANNFLKTTQNVLSKNPGIRGGIKGSHPIWGTYSPYEFLNWATKFFIDALILEEIFRNPN